MAQSQVSNSEPSFYFPCCSKSPQNLFNLHFSVLFRICLTLLSMTRLCTNTAWQTRLFSLVLELLVSEHWNNFFESWILVNPDNHGRFLPHAHSYWYFLIDFHNTHILSRWLPRRLWTAQSHPKSSPHSVSLGVVRDFSAADPVQLGRPNGCYPNITYHKY